MATNKEPETSSVIGESLQKVAKGSSIIFIGSLLGLLPAFLGRIIITRYWAKSDYGLYSLALAILTICVVISTLGLIQGVSRNIAYARGKKDYSKMSSLISASIWFSFLVSIIAGIILFLSSEIISLKIFHEPELIAPLKIFSMVVPLLTLINVIVSIFRGFDQIKPYVYFQQLLLQVLFPIFIIVVIVLNLSFKYVFFAFAASTFITLLALIIYSLKNAHNLALFSLKFITASVSRELLIFSIPLLFSAILNSLLHLTDTLMLGSLKNTTEVGLYNAALPAAHFISFPLIALIMIYIPIFTGLYARNKHGEIRRNYSILTKWLCSASFPLFAVLFLYPEQSLSFLFGSTYAPSANALRILSFGFIFDIFVGPCGASLIGIGKSRFVMFASFTMVILNISLNVILIPFYGIIGAAIATMVSLTSINIIQSVKLYSLIGAISISKNIIKPTVLSLTLISLFYIISKNFISVKWWMLIVILISFYIIYILSILITRSLDKEDLKMLQILEAKTGKKSKILRRLLLKFQ
jgi:O-antigen/teichoic acid export membrane protein